MDEDKGRVGVGFAIFLSIILFLILLFKISRIETENLKTNERLDKLERNIYKEKDNERQ